MTRAAIAIVLMAVGAPHALAGAVGVNTRFGYVAEFPIGATSVQIETWRSQVLGRSHQQACIGGRPCVARMVRLALVGSAGREVIAFDLMQEVSPGERAAIVAAAVAELPGTALHPDARPADLDSSDLVSPPVTEAQ